MEGVWEKLRSWGGLRGPQSHAGTPDEQGIGSLATTHDPHLHTGL